MRKHFWAVLALSMIGCTGSSASQHIFIPSECGPMSPELKLPTESNDPVLSVTRFFSSYSREITVSRGQSGMEVNYQERFPDGSQIFFEFSLLIGYSAEAGYLRSPISQTQRLDADDLAFIQEAMSAFDEVYRGDVSPERAAIELATECDSPIWVK